MPPQKPENLVQKALAAIKSEFVVVRKQNIKTWEAWLLLGVVVGVASGVFFL